MNDSKKFFCIRGFMKSGTNWVCRILNTHPDVNCVGEFHWESFFNALHENVSRIAPRRQELLDNTVRPELQAMVRQCLTSLSNDDANMIGDRTPTTIDPIVLHVPHIVIVRDFRDVMVSRMFHLFNNPRVTRVFDNFPEMKVKLEKYQKNRWYFRENPGELLAEEEIVRDSGRDWSLHQRSDRKTVTDNSDLPVKFIRYEDLHFDFDRHATSLFEFLQIDPPSTIPDALKPGHDTENPGQLNRNGQIGDWKNYITEDVKKWINDTAGEELLRQNFVSSIDW